MIQYISITFCDVNQWPPSVQGQDQNDLIKTADLLQETHLQYVHGYIVKTPHLVQGRHLQYAHGYIVKTAHLIQEHIYNMY